MMFRRVLFAGLALAGSLASATEASAQALQRVYLAPQTVRLEPGKPTILRGACLDERIVGAPKSRDRITRFSDPDGLVIRELKGGKPTGREQKYGDILTGKEKEPWVEVRGGSDLSRGVDLSVRSVGKFPPGISFEITVKRGMATAREQEKITDVLIDQIKRYQAPIDYIDGEFETWTKLFGAQNRFAPGLTEFAQKKVYWGITGDRQPEDILADAKRQVEQMFAGLRDEDPVRQYLLVAAATGRAEFGQEHKDFLAKYKITLKDLPADDRPSRMLAAGLAHSRTGIGLEKLNTRLAQWQKDQEPFLKKVKAASDDAEALPPETRARVEVQLAGMLAQHLNWSSDRKSIETRLAKLSASLSRMKDASEVLTRVAKAYESLPADLPAGLRAEVKARRQFLLDAERWATEPEAQRAQAELGLLATNLTRLRDPEVAKVWAEFDGTESAVRGWGDSPVRAEMLDRVDRARLAFLWGERAELARAQQQLKQFAEARERVGAQEGRNCVELAQELGRNITALSSRDISLSFTASQNLQALVRLFVAGSQAEARLAHGRMQDFAVRVRELAGKTTPSFLTAARKAEESSRGLGAALRMVGFARLNELKQASAWSKTPKERQAAERELELLPDALKKFDPGAAKELDDQLRNYERELNSGRGDYLFTTKWRTYLRLTLRDVVLEAGPRQTAAKRNWLKFSEDLKATREALVQTVQSTTARPVFKDGKAWLEVGGRTVAAAEAAPAGTNLLVDTRGLTEEQFKQIVEAAGRSKGHLVLQESEAGAEQFRQLPGAERLTVLSDSQAVEQGVAREKLPLFLTWLEAVATDYRGVVSPRADGRVEIVVDHFSQDGKAFARLRQRLEQGEFVGKHVILLICNPDLPRFREFAQDARTWGGALSVTYPRESLQLTPVPLILEVLKKPGRLTPSLSPAETVEQAAAIVLERLKRCQAAPDKARAVKEEFPSASGDPAELFRVKGTFSERLLAEIVNQLERQQYGLQTQVRADRPEDGLDRI